MMNDETVLYGTNANDPTTPFTPPENPVTCLTIKVDNPAFTDGIYEIDPDGDGGNSPYDAYCDMTTQGGGWTLAIRYDTDLTTSTTYALPVGAGRTAINPEDMTTLDATSNVSASIDMRPFIKGGATHLMHVTTAPDDVNYTYTYFSDIYLYVRLFPDSLFDPNEDSNDNEGVFGDIVDWSASIGNQWYESDFTVMTNTQTSGDTGSSHKAINGGEGNAMFTNGDREGALYSSGLTTTGSAIGHTNPKVQWGFTGEDGTFQSYGGATHVGTYCDSTMTECAPASRMNFMFIR